MHNCRIVRFFQVKEYSHCVLYISLSAVSVHMQLLFRSKPVSSDVGPELRIVGCTASPVVASY